MGARRRLILAFATAPWCILFAQVPKYVTGDECLFCHRDSIGDTWQGNAHTITMRQKEDAPEYVKMVASQPALAALLPDAQLFNDELAEALSGREQEVLDLLAEGLSNKLIAQGLNISEHTVKTHVASIFVKLGASSRTEAVSQAIRRGLVML